jgi:hypothetical protein
MCRFAARSATTRNPRPRVGICAKRGPSQKITTRHVRGLEELVAQDFRAEKRADDVQVRAQSGEHADVCDTIVLGLELGNSLLRITVRDHRTPISRERAGNENVL